MKSVLVRLNEYKNEASSSEKELIKFIFNNTKLAVEYNIHELATHTFVSASSITRFCKKLGFNGFKDFRNTLIYELAIRQQSLSEEKKELSRLDSIEDIIEKITYKNIISLENTRKLIDVKTLEKCVELIIKSRNICLFGIGSSLIVARDAYLKFLRLNKSCIINDDWHSQLLQARNMSPNDIAIIISYSGQTTEMIECAKAVHESGALVITITKYGTTPISSFSDYKLYVAANESTFRSGAISSRISQLNIIDILYIAFANSQYNESLNQISRTHIMKPN